jgi:Protein of unknown function (DUF3570)
MQLRLAAALVLVAGAARADGVVGVRGAYYKERSTRVIQPMIDAAFDAGDRGRAEGHFLVDSITSASASTGAGAAEFTEQRYELGVGYVHEIAPVRIGGDVRYSTESDYNAFVFGLRGELDLAEKTTLLRLRFAAGWDDVTNGVEVDMGGIGTPRRSEKLSTTLLSTGVQQLVGDRLVLSATYDLMRASGYQANIYRLVFGGTMPVAERVPDLRWRHALALSGRWWFPSETVLVASARVYHDDWGIDAVTPEVRVVQQIVSGIDVRLRYRVHAQTRADFYEDVYTAEQIADEARFITDDEKLSAHHTHTLGAQGVFALRRLGVAGTWGDAQLDLVIERVWQSTSFGHAWVAQAGLVLPFAY